MTYNIEIKNKGVLPIPFVDKCGDQVAARSLYTDKPIFRDVLCIGATSAGQLLIHCVTLDTIIEPSPDLEIELPRPTKQSE